MDEKEREFMRALEHRSSQIPERIISLTGPINANKAMEILSDPRLDNGEMSNTFQNIINKFPQEIINKIWDYCIDFFKKSSEDRIIQIEHSGGIEFMNVQMFSKFMSQFITALNVALENYDSEKIGGTLKDIAKSYWTAREEREDG